MPAIAAVDEVEEKKPQPVEAVAPAEIPPAKPPTPAPVAPTSPKPIAEPTGSGPGAILWTFPQHTPGQGPAPTAVRNCPAIAEDGTIFAAIGPLVYGLCEDDAKVTTRWQKETGANIPGSPAIGNDGRVRVHSGDGHLYCLDGEGDLVYPPLAIEEPLGWASPVVDSLGHTWICNYNGGLTRIEPTGGKPKRPFFRSRQKFDCTGVIRGGSLFVGGEDGFIYSIKLTGSRGTNSWNHVADRGKTQWFINSSPAPLPGNILLVAGRDEYLYAFRADGQEDWRVHIPGQMLGSPVIDTTGDIYVGVADIKRGEAVHGRLVCVTTDTHRVRWEYRADGPVECTPVIGDDGMIYFGDNAGTVHAVTRDGQCDWKRNVGSAVRCPGTITQDGNVLFGTDAGTLVALASTSEKLLPGGWPKYMGTLGQSGNT